MAVAYALLKLAAYTGWCWVGLRLFRAPEPPRAKTALAFGALRLGLGLGFGVAIYLLASLAAAATRSQVAAYLLVYVPVRWVEWGILETLMRRGPATASAFAFGAGSAARGWRARGILLSCLADLPVIASMGGLPLGRFMC